MKEKWLFTMFNVKIISPLLWNLLLPHSSNNFFVGWTLAGSTWLLTHTDSLKLLLFFFYMFSVLLTKCDFYVHSSSYITDVNILYTHITWCSFKFVLYLRQTQVLYSGFSSHLILKEEFPAILWQKLQHAVFVCGSCHS
jgi:hypothetical protein